VPCAPFAEFQELSFLGFMAFYLAFKLTLGSSSCAPAMIFGVSF
jgi:hypothetical protein